MIWIFDETGSLTQEVQRCLGNHYTYRSFIAKKDLKRLAESRFSGTPPSLVITSSHLRVNRDTAPWIVISNCKDPSAISSCLRDGALDYLIQPVDSHVLQAKVKALVNLRSFETGEILPGFMLDLDKRVITGPEKKRVQITKKQLQILRELTQAAPEGVSPSDLRRAIWKNVKVVPKSLDVHLFHLRQKVEPIGLQIKFLPRGKYLLTKE